MSTGCLVPLPIEEEPAEINYPPFYEFGDVDPSFVREVVVDVTTQPTFTFTVRRVDDPNAEDQLSVRWFVNYNGTNIGQTLVSPPEQRDQALAFSVTPCAQPEPPRNDTPERELMRIELIVADRPFLNRQDQPEGAPAPHQALPSTAGSFRIVWFMRFDRTACPVQ